MRFSIVTTCLNAATTIERTARSILSQNGDFEVEYIITDAGSKDQTVKIIESVAREYQHKVMFIDAFGLNQSQGINRGLQSATGDIVSFLNGDDVYKPDTFIKVQEGFVKNPTSLWLVGFCSIIDEHDNEMHSFVTKYKNFLLSRYHYWLLTSENFICQPAVFLRRAAIEQYGYFSEAEHYTMDYEYWLRIGAQHKPVILQEYLSAFRRMANTKSNSGYVQQFKDDMRLGITYAFNSGNYHAIPLKVFNFIKTVTIYSFLYR